MAPTTRQQSQKAKDASGQKRKADEALQDPPSEDSINPSSDDESMPPLQEVTDEEVVEEKQDDIFGEGAPDAEDVMQMLPIAKQVVAALSELKGLSAHTRKEDGVVRTSVHFKTGK